MQLLAVTVNGRWQPGIGDPTPLGWGTTVAYLVAAGLCLWAWRRERRLRDTGVVPRFWLVAGVLMLALGVNKQLDLQSFLTQVGKDIARRDGWYGERKVVQAAFIGVVGLAGVTVVGLLFWWLRGRLRRYWVAVVGVTYIVCFVVIRASSMHHVDALLGLRMGHVKMNHVLELGGIVLIGWGAVRAGRLAGRGGRAKA